MKGCVLKYDEKEHLTYHYILANHPGISGTVPEAFKIIPEIIHVASIYTNCSNLTYPYLEPGYIRGAGTQVLPECRLR